MTENDTESGGNNIAQVKIEQPTDVHQWIIKSEHSINMNQLILAHHALIRSDSHSVSLRYKLIQLLPSLFLTLAEGG